MPGREKKSGTTIATTPTLQRNWAPIYEDKVVDFILELANVTEKKVTKEDLYKDEDEKTAA